MADGKGCCRIVELAAIPDADEIDKLGAFKANWDPTPGLAVGNQIGRCTEKAFLDELAIKTIKWDNDVASVAEGD